MKDAHGKIENLTFGCELEYEGITQAAAAKAVARVVGGIATYRGTHLSNWEVAMADGRKWQIVSDGSLTGGAETVTPILKLADMAMLQEVVRELRRSGAKVSERTGLHVHVGARHLTPMQVRNLVKVFYRQEKLILKAAGTRPRRIARYTRLTDHAFVERIAAMADPTMETINAAWFGTFTPHPHHYDDHRYRALNLNNLLEHGGKGTVEFRFFEGTLHAGEVRTAVLLALSMVAFSAEAKAASAKHQRTTDEARKSDRYKFRCFLLRLGWVGDEFKNPRAHLAKHLTGSAAWLDGEAHGRAAA